MSYDLYDVYGYKIYLDVAESGMMKMRSMERYEVAKFNWLRDNLSAEDVFIDVGANKGDFALFAAMRCKYVIAVEPHPDNIEWLNKSILANGFENVKVLQGCATTEDGMVKLGVGNYSGHHSMTGRRSEYILVNGFALDNVLSRNNSYVMKIDVEGAEKLVLEGAKETLKNTRALLIDVDSGDLNGVMSYLKDFEIVCHSGKEIIVTRK